jgi:hypothetical protein
MSRQGKDLDRAQPVVDGCGRSLQVAFRLKMVADIASNRDRSTGMIVPLGNWFMREWVRADQYDQTQDKMPRFG